MTAATWLAQNPEEASLVLPSGLLKHFKVLGFLTIWFSIPVILISALLSTAGQVPQIYQGEPAGTVAVYFKVLLKGVQKKGVANQPIFFKLQDLQTGNLSQFDTLGLQDEQTFELFRGKLNLPAQATTSSFTVWVKGPVHLTRRFDNITFSSFQDTDLTAKPLLPGDLILSDTGSRDKIDALSRDYLWSIVAKDSRKPTSEELRAADLDLDGRITGRDFSLLLDTGVGSIGEK